MSLDTINNLIPLINLLGTIGVALWVWLRSPSQAQVSRLEQHDEEIEGLRRDTGDRLVAIESRLQFIPTVTELSELQASVREINANQESLQREVHAMRDSVRRIEDFLLRTTR